MPTIKINLDDRCLEFTDDNKITMKIDPSSSIEITDDGLYAPAPPGDPGSTGEGYPNGLSEADTVSIGLVSPYGGTYDKRVNATLLTHRVFTCTQSDGSDINIRNNVTGDTNTGDYVLPGDFYRVKNGIYYDYYIVLSTSGGSTGEGGTSVKEYQYIVSVPITNRLCINDQ